MGSVMSRASIQHRRPRYDEQVYIGDEVIPGNLENNRPPILVDECEKFGLSEIYGVTAGQ